ncbi:MAG: DUF4440 domain-containing protein [Phycisphaerae bacterium]
MNVRRCTGMGFFAVSLASLAMSGGFGCAAVQPVPIATTLLDAQASAWNRGDIDGFMAFYWKSEMLSFSSGGNTTYGWQATRDRFAARYPDAATMGSLRFDIDDVQRVAREALLVLGRWHLSREIAAGGDVGGNFSLVMKQFADGWRIVHDHTSMKENDE